MTRPTVNDIAREAGVSLATVDRVLNDRPGVREKTVLAVNAAVARLGYVRDMAAANLARSRDYHMVVVLPDGESQFLNTLLGALQMAASQAAMARTRVTIRRFPAEDMHALAALLAGMEAAEVSGIALMAPETPLVRDAVRSLKDKGIAVVALVTDLPSTARDHFVGIDNRAAGRTAGVLMGRFLGARPGRVLVLAQSMLLRDAIERRRGFDEVMLSDFPQIEVLQTLEAHGSTEVMRQVVTEMLRNAPDVTGLYLLGAGHRALTTVLRDLRLLGALTIIGHELTPHTRIALEMGQMDAVITQNAGHLARSALRVLRAKADRAPIDHGQEQLRIEIILRENLPPEDDSAPLF